MNDTGMTRITASGCLNELNRIDDMKNVITATRARSQYFSPLISAFHLYSSFSA